MEISINACRWLAHGERGVSSETIFSVITGVAATNGWKYCHPYDDGDFRRCRLLLEECPEFLPLMHKVAELSPEWRRLITHWDLICLTMDKEMPTWREKNQRTGCEKTYYLIKDILQGTQS